MSWTSSERLIYIQFSPVSAGETTGLMTNKWYITAAWDKFFEIFRKKGANDRQ